MGTASTFVGWLAARKHFIAPAAVIFSLGASGLAIGQSGNRQTITFVFDQHRPATGTGLRVDIDYVPDDPSAKPAAVQTVVETLAPGTRIDTSVPERCGASDAQLMAQGAAACPPGSRVGSGQVDLDTGIPAPGRIVHNDVTEFNNKDELILLFEPTSGSGSLRAVARAPITDGRTITAQSPPLPGGPPDGFTALKTVRLSLDAVSVSQGPTVRNYLTTPDSCPAQGSWRNTITFTYRDGQSQTATSNSPCERQGARPPPPRSARPRLRLAVRPSLVRVCRHTRFRFRVTARGRSAASVSGVTIRFAGRRMRTDRRGRATIVATLRRAGIYRARATKPGYLSASARVRLPACAATQRRTAPRFTG